jgi:hypothetical protein
MNSSIDIRTIRVGPPEENQVKKSSVIALYKQNYFKRSV